MAYHQMHLIRGGKGMATKSACGRNILRMQLAGNWESFKATKPADRCEKCEASKQAALNRKRDEQKMQETISVDDLNGWVPEDDPNAWMIRDAALIAARWS